MEIYRDILKSTNKKLLANLLDVSGKIILPASSLSLLIATLTKVPQDLIQIQVEQKETGCIAKINPFQNIVSIKLNRLDFFTQYNAQYNQLESEFAISLKRALVN
jgi:hypothetical protein